MHRRVTLALVALAGCFGGQPPPVSRLELNIDRTERRGGFSAVRFKVERGALFYGSAPKHAPKDCSLAGGLQRSLQSPDVNFDLLATGLVRLGELEVAPGPIAELRLLISAATIEHNGRWVDADVRERCRETQANGQKRELGVLRLLVTKDQAVMIDPGELERVRVPFDPNRDIVIKRDREAEEDEHHSQREHRHGRDGNHDEDDDDDGDDDDDHGGSQDAGIQRDAGVIGDAGTVGDAGLPFDPCGDGGHNPKVRLLLASRYKLLPIVAPPFGISPPSVQLATHECRYDVVEAFEDLNSPTPVDGDAERIYDPPLRFEIPAQIRVATGNAGNRRATLTWWLGGVRTECLYQGGASVQHPRDEIELAKGKRYVLVGCSTRSGAACIRSSFRAGEIGRADALALHVEGDAARGVTGARIALAEVDPCVIATSAAGSGPTLAQRAIATRTGDALIPIVPESAFRAALASATMTQAPPTALVRAATTAGIANDPWTGGIIATFESNPNGVPFSGDVIIVARNPVLPAGTQAVEVTDYAVVAGHFAGTSPWKGSAFSYGVVPNQNVGSASCCGRTPSCQPSVPTPGGGTGCDLTGFCVGQTIDLQPNFPQSTTSEDTRFGLGTPPIPMHAYGSSIGPGPLPPPNPIDLSCLPPPDPSCGHKTPVCDQEQPTTFTGSWEVLFPGKDTCMQSQSHPVAGRDVPEFCTQVSSYGAIPVSSGLGVPSALDCGYYCWDCGLAYCEQNCAIPELPPMCGIAQVDPMNGDLCVSTDRSNQARRDMEQAQARIAALACQSATPTSTCCGQGCFCEPANEHGIQLCTNCQGSTCTKTARVPQRGFDPNAAGCDDFDEGCEIEGEVGQGRSPTPPRPEFGPIPQTQPSTQAGRAERFEATVASAPDPKPGIPPPPPPSSNPGPKKPTETTDKRSGPKPPTNQPGDPVALGDGSLVVSQTDLSFPGPARSLTFTRSYTSTSGRRSALGSNWSHNWDVWLEPLTEDTRPSWVDPYCSGSYGRSTCLFLHGGDDSIRLFYFDAMTHLFLPQAGSFDSLLETSSGWKLRAPDGQILYFNKEGHLTADRDRFGNGFVIDEEPTPLYRLFRHTCSVAVPVSEDVGDSRAPLEGVTHEKLLSNERRVLAGLLGLAALPPPGHAAWRTTSADFPIPSGDAELSFARSYFLSLKGTGPEAYAPHGSRLMRPKRVTDDEGRQLVFAYKRDASAFDTELLTEVHGPVGTHLTFTYATPPGHPLELHEAFLKRVQRSDSPMAAGIVAAQPRDVAFEYLWSGALQSPSSVLADAVENAWFNYYQSFVGCALHTVLPCGAPGTSTFAPGAAGPLARIARNAYVSRVADDIISITVAGTLESESRYRLDPFAADFDRVQAQRFGSTAAGSRPQGTTSFTWASAQPIADFDYRSAGGDALSGAFRDATESFLPSAVRARYPIEVPPPAAEDCIRPRQLARLAEGEVVSAAATLANLSPVHAATRPACRYDDADFFAAALPGARREYCYFDSTRNGADVDAPLKRSAVSCEVLASAQTWDSTHNDLVAQLLPDLSTPVNPLDAGAGDYSDYLAVARTGRRTVMAANANRICAWAKYTDRDGDVRYSGLNYQGQVLVDALLQKDGHFLFTETLFNADGHVVSQRRPLDEASIWSSTSGDTLYTYDELEPSGSSGWNLWQPAYWARRANIVFTRTRPRGGTVADELEGTLPLTLNTSGRFTRTRYEPLFNQPLKHEEGFLLRQGTPPFVTEAQIVTRRREWLYDYQELSLVNRNGPHGVGPVLEALRPFGFAWLSPAVVADWQLAMNFILDSNPAHADVNGDGIFGHSSSDPQRRGVGLPIQLLDYGADGVTFEAYSFVWASHGQPANVQAPGGASWAYEYLERGQLSPTATNLSPGNTGFLGEVRARSGRADYALAEGPHHNGLTGPARAPCAALSGPWQWVLPSSCGSDVAAGLRARGLPEAAVQAILDTRPATGVLDETTSLSWNAAGAVHRVVAPNGGTTELTRDTDGRVTALLDASGVATTTHHTALGFPDDERRTGPSGQALGKTLRSFDEEGHVLSECVELVAGGCSTASTAPAPGQGVATRAQYTREGQLLLATDGEGTSTFVAYDARKLPTHVQTLAKGTVVGTSPTTHVAPPGEPVRTEQFTRDVDGMVTLASHGSGLTSESFTYDGLIRLATHVDTLDRPWRINHSPRDLVTSVNDDFGGGALNLWRVSRSYDNFERLTEERTNGFITHQLARRQGGLPFARTADGEGLRVATYDPLGRVVFEEDSAGNQVVYTYSPSRRQATTTTLEVGARQSLAIGVVTDFDALWRPVSQTESGGGLTRSRAFERDALGFVTLVTEPDTAQTKHFPNLLGWDTDLWQQRAAGSAQFDKSSFVYNARGQAVQVADAANQLTLQLYNGFGEVKERDVPGTPGVQTTFELNTLGQVTKRTVGPATVRYAYNTRAQLTDAFNAANEQLFHRSYDLLGRLAQAVNFNVAARTLPPLASGRAAGSIFLYDALGRVARDSQLVDAQPLRTVESQWTLSAAAPHFWQRQLTYPSGTVWVEKYDGDGRLASKTGGPNGRTSTYDYVGNRYAGRNVGRLSASLLRQSIDFDALGQPASWRATAVDLADTGLPLNAAEGDAYCGGSWTAACSKPLLSIDALRDVRGRAVSVNRSWAPPQLTADESWRGYLYDAMGRVGSAFEQASRVSAGSFATHSITTAQVRQLASGSTEWAYQREAAIGDLLTISQAAAPAVKRFEAAPRGPGHQLVSVTPPSAPARLVSHDGAGRISSDGDSRFEWDDLHELAVVTDSSNVLREGFLYDGLGRLAATVAPDTQFNPSVPRIELIRNVLVYDGLQIVEAFKVTPTQDAEWQASWGPGIDNLESVRHTVVRGCCSGLLCNHNNSCAGASDELLAIVDERNSVVGAWSVGLSLLLTVAEYSPEGRIVLKSADGQMLCDDTTDSSCLGPTATPFGFNGAFKSSTGLVFMRSRWYSPALAQFLSHDPIGFADSYSLYAFAGFDPINRRDPFGLQVPCVGADTASCAQAGAAMVSAGAAWGGWAGTTWGGAAYSSVALPSASVGAAATGTGLAVGTVVAAAVAVPLVVAGTVVGFNAWVDSPVSFPGVNTLTEPGGGTPGAIDPQPTTPRPPSLDPPSAGTPDVPIGDQRGPATLVQEPVEGVNEPLEAASKRSPSSETLRRRWEAENKKPWPWDPEMDRNQDVSHKKPLSEGGANDLTNIEPLPHQEHVDEHKKKGDFKRWGEKGAEKKKKLLSPKSGSNVGFAD